MYNYRLPQVNILPYGVNSTNITRYTRLPLVCGKPDNTGSGFTYSIRIYGHISPYVVVYWLSLQWF